MHGENTNAIIRKIIHSFLHNYQIELKMIKGSTFVFESVDLLDYKLQRVPLKRGGSYIKSLKWLLHKQATINPKNENDDECLRWSIISTLNYNKITKKEFENIFEKIRYQDKDFSSHKRDWGNFEQSKSIAPNVLFSLKDSEEIKLLYKSEYNLERENKVLLLMINDDDNEKYQYVAVKSKLELCSFEWARSKKESITNEDNCFQNALNDSLDYQTIKTQPERISKLKPYINQYNWKT